MTYPIRQALKAAVQAGCHIADAGTKCTFPACPCDRAMMSRATAAAIVAFLRAMPRRRDAQRETELRALGVQYTAFEVLAYSPTALADAIERSAKEST